MKRASLNDFGIRWTYWVVASGFTIAGAFAIYAIRIEPQSRVELMLYGAFFVTIGFLAFLWPVLRVREQQGIEHIITPHRRIPYRGTFVPVSYAKIGICLIGGTALGIGALLAALLTHDPADRIKGALAFAVYVSFFMIFIWQMFSRRPGVLLTDDGLVWNDYFFTTGLIRWDAVEAARMYIHCGKHNKTPSFGLRLRDVGNLRLSGNIQRKLTQNANRWGWHCYYHAESLLVPLPILEEVVNFYRQHPSARPELTTGSSMSRFQFSGQ